MTGPKRCKDCAADAPLRPAPFPGPRCFSCNRAAVKAAKDRAHDRMVCRKYGLQPGEYAEILAAQGGVCFVCGWATGKAQRLSVDHDHACCPELPACGKCVRGLVCRPCNREVLGRIRTADAARRLVYMLGPVTVGAVLIARRAARGAHVGQGGRLGPLAGEWPGHGVPIAHRATENDPALVRDTPEIPITL